MAKGDQIYAMRPFAGLDAVYEHHGIDCGDGTVIHYYKGGGEPVVERTPIEVFARGTPIYTRKSPIAYIPDVVVERAESRIGERRYDLLNNNCEHFANWCKTGQNTSQQLLNYGLEPSRLGMLANRRAIEEAANEGDPAKAIALMQQALGNLSTTQADLLTQYNKAQDEVITWDRVARLALQKQREDLAKAALERKVEAKRRAASLQDQLALLAETELNLRRNSTLVNQRLAYS